MEVGLKPVTAVRMSEVVSALSYALDLTEGRPVGHSVRTCLIAMRLAAAVGLSPPERAALFYAALLKDAGCSSNAARVCALFGGDDQPTKEAMRRVDWARLDQAIGYAFRHSAPGAPAVRRVWHLLAVARLGRAGARSLFATRCVRGADIVASLGFSPLAAEAVRALDEHWDGGGAPEGLRGAAIPLLARILGLAQTLEVYVSAYGLSEARAMSSGRRGRWFDPALVDLLTSWWSDVPFWESLAAPDPERRVLAFEPPDQVRLVDEDALDLLAKAFAQIVDAKTPYTYAHSTRVTDIALGVAEVLDLPPPRRRLLRRAALLHDIGKLGVSNRILDKPGRLTAAEFSAVRRHPADTEAILARVAAFRGVAAVAAAHHERLDGRGYHRGVDAAALPLDARVLTAADVFEALTADRPYRGALSTDEALVTMARDVGSAFDAEVFAALGVAVAESTPVPRA